MPVTPNEILEAALALGKGNSEPDWRNAASRAYYAAFHRCLPIGIGYGMSEDALSAHASLTAVLTHPLRPNAAKSIGYMLHQCKQHRVVADYGIKDEFLRNVSDTVLETCQNIFVKADGLDPQ